MEYEYKSTFILYIFMSRKKLQVPTLLYSNLEAKPV